MSEMPSLESRDTLEFIAGKKGLCLQHEALCGLLQALPLTEVVTLTKSLHFFSQPLLPL